MGVFRATGRALSAWQSDPHEGAITGRPVRIAAMPPREDLYERINIRFSDMMARGAKTEVATLAARGLDPSLPVMKAIGVREIMALQACSAMISRTPIAFITGSEGSRPRAARVATSVLAPRAIMSENLMLILS